MWMPSLDLATGLWARMRRTLYTLFSRLSRAAQRFWMSRAYFPVLLTVSAAFMAAGEPVYGVAALGCIVIWLLPPARTCWPRFARFSWPFSCPPSAMGS